MISQPRRRRGLGTLQVNTSKSTIGYVFFYESCAISWFSKLHTFVTTCTNHSEYAALAQGAKEAQWLVYLFDELEHKAKHTPVPIFVDNTGVVSICFDHAANKHLRVSLHYARELMDLKTIVAQRVSSENNLADIFTKAILSVLYPYVFFHNYIKSVIRRRRLMTPPTPTGQGELEWDSKPSHTPQALPGADWHRYLGTTSIIGKVGNSAGGAWRPVCGRWRPPPLSTTIQRCVATVYKRSNILLDVLAIIS